MLAALLLMICLGCSKSKNQDVSLSIVDAKQEDRAYIADTTTPVNSQYEQQPQKENENQNPVNLDWDKKIIKTATLQVETKDYKKYYSSIYPSVKRVGGYVAQEDQNQTEYKNENVLTIKVPVQQFDEALGILINGTGNEKLVEKKIGSEDVTGQVIDVMSRLEAKREARLRYLDLLKQAKNMQEVLQVQKEINDLQEEIEMAAGRMSYLNHSADYSTIQLTFFQVLNPSAHTDKEPSFFLKLVKAFENGWNFIQQLLLGLISIWPLIIVVAGIWLGFRKWKLAKVKTA